MRYSLIKKLNIISVYWVGVKNKYKKEIQKTAAAHRNKNSLSRCRASEWSRS